MSKLTLPETDDYNKLTIHDIAIYRIKVTIDTHKRCVDDDNLSEIVITNICLKQTAYHITPYDKEWPKVLRKVMKHLAKRNLG